MTAFLVSGRLLTTGLVAAERLTVLPGCSEITSWLLTFDESVFVPACFEREGIACPPTISRSVAKRQAEFFFGRLAARLALSGLGARETSVPIGGAREPLWPPGYVGSITHCTGLAATAVARCGDRFSGIGIDMEWVAGSGELDALHSMVIDDAEWSCLQAAADVFPDDVLATIAFSAKESLYKAVFPSLGRFFDFRAARVVEPPNVAGTLTLLIAEDLGVHFPRGRRCKVGFDTIRARLISTSFVW